MYWGKGGCTTVSLLRDATQVTIDKDKIFTSSAIC